MVSSRTIPAALILLSSASLIAAQKTAPKARPAAKRPAVARTAAAQPPGVPLTRLTSAEVQSIIESEGKGNPRALAALAAGPAERKQVLDNLRDALAIASEAYKTGLAADPSIKMQLDLARDEELARAYHDKLKAAGGTDNLVTGAGVDKFFAMPANKIKYAPEEARVLAYVKAQQAKSAVPDAMDAEARQKSVVAEWKKVKYAAVKAQALKLAGKKTELNWKLQQSLLLARAYTQEKLKDRLTPTDAEIKELMASDARFSKAPQRARAEEVWRKAAAGDDFAALANQYTEDPGNAGDGGAPQGGLYDWRDRAAYVKEFADASWALNEGQISPVVETQFGYHVIKLEGKRVAKNSAGRDEEQVKVRHILIGTGYKPAAGAAADPYANPFKSMEEGARDEISEKKQKAVMAEIMKRNPIVLPADFTVTVPEITEDGGSGAALSPPPPVAPRALPKP